VGGRVIRYAWIDGRIVPETEAAVPAADRGFLYGDGLFETVRVYGGRAFRLAEHWARLASSAAFLGLPPPPAPAPVVTGLVDANRAPDAVVRFTWTRGPLPAGPRPGPAGRPLLLATLRPLPADLADRRDRGMEARTLPWPLRARGLPLQGHKTLAYLDSVLALGRVPPGAEPLLTTTEGHLAEGATSNLFWIREDRLFTPHPDTGCLPGIAREVILRLARAAGLRLDEGFYEPRHLVESDEAFLTNSVVEVVPLVSVDDRPVGSGVPGPRTRWFQRAYARLVQAETRRP